MKQFFQTYWVLCAIVIVFLIVRILSVIHPSTPLWDASVYVGMGKYLFSHGTIGTWEALRPLGLPLVLGLAWKVGLNPYTAGIIFSLIVSAAMLVLVYFFAEEIKEGAGNPAAIVLATAGVFFSYTAVPITDIISSFFALLSLFLVYRSTTTRQYFFSGLVVAIAFNFRFPQGLLLVVGGIVIIAKMILTFKKKKWNDQMTLMIENLFAFAGGFFVIVVPCLIANQYFYHNAFLPYIEATASITGYPSLYQLGIGYYFKQLFFQDPLFLLALLPIGLLWKKNYRSIGVIAVATGLVVVMGYFLYQVHEEQRFMLAFLPYIAVLTGVGILYVLERYEVPIMLFLGVMAIAAFMVHAGALVYAKQNPDTPSFNAFDSYLSTAPHARVLTTTPYLLADSDVLITHNLYADWNAAYSDYNTFRTTNDYIALDSCSLELGCADNSHCKDDKQLLLDELNKQDTKVFSTVTPSMCELSIYKISH